MSTEFITTFSHDIVEELHYWYPPVWIIMKQFGVDSGSEEKPDGV